MGKREPVALLSLSSWCFMVGVWLFLAVSWVCLQFVIVVFPDHAYNFTQLATKGGAPNTFHTYHPRNAYYQSTLILTELFQHNLINVSYLMACYLYQVMMKLHFLNDVANDAESTQKSKIAS